MKRERHVSAGLILAVLLGYAAWVVYPMVWMVYSSLKTDAAIAHAPFALPAFGDLRFDNYGHAWRILATIFSTPRW